MGVSSHDGKGVDMSANPDIIKRRLTSVMPGQLAFMRKNTAQHSKGKRALLGVCWSEQVNIIKAHGASMSFFFYYPKKASKLTVSNRT